MLTTDQSIIVTATPQQVWRKINNFHDLSWGKAVIAEVEKKGSVEGDQVGAMRILNGVIHETLQSIDHENYRISYSIDSGPSPISEQEVSNYVGVIELNAVDGGATKVRWSSSWDSEQQDAVAFCSDVYNALLNALSQSFDGAE